MLSRAISLVVVLLQARAPGCRPHRLLGGGQRRVRRRRHALPQAAQQEEVEGQQEVVQARQVEAGQEVGGTDAVGSRAQVQEQQVGGRAMVT